MQCHHFMANRWGINRNSDRLLLLLLFWVPKSLQMVSAVMELKHLLLGSKAMTNLDSILKSRDITLPTNFYLVKTMVFPVIMYSQKIDASKLSCWRRLLRILWTTRKSNQSILMEISPEYSMEGLMLKLKFQYFGHLKGRTDSMEKTLMLRKIEGRRRRGC